MEFVCTEKMDVEKQVKVIANEIGNEYPDILPEKILEIAVLSDTVHKNATEDTFFQRYYIILQSLGKESPIYNRVYSDMVKVCNNKLHNKMYRILYNDIVKYQNNLIKEFPCISDYFDNNLSNEQKVENAEIYKDNIFNTQKDITCKDNTLLPEKVRENSSIWEKIKDFFKKILK